MPRQTIDELAGYRFAVGRRTVPVTDERGNVIFNGGGGGPKTREETLVEFVDAQPTHLHIVRIPLSDEAREELARLLLGGIAVAKQMPSGPLVL